VTATLTFLSAVSTAADGKAGIDSSRLARIAPRMQAFVDQGTIAGAVTLIIRRGVVGSLDVVGYQDLESRKPMRADTIFQVMSMTKPVTAAGVMMLVEEGKLALTDPVEKHLPEFRGQWVVEASEAGVRRLVRPSRPILIRDLMTHTSGMAELPPESLPDFYRKLNLTLAEAVSIFSQQPLLFDPGKKWNYSNPGIAILARIQEVVSGQSYEKFLDVRLFKPLGMKDSFFLPPAEKKDRIASVYVLEEGKLKKFSYDIYRTGARYPMPEGGLYATAADMGAFYQMMLQKGRWQGRQILSAASVEVMTALHTGSIEPAGHSPGMGYGLAWTFVRDAMGTLQLQSEGTFGHGGYFGTHGWIDAKKELIGVFLVQRLGASQERNAFMSLAAAAVE
jgi:CubicO group peptidase (beta-lactamase class C family)